MIMKGDRKDICDRTWERVLGFELELDIVRGVWEVWLNFVYSLRRNPIRPFRVAVDSWVLFVSSESV
jgi:hypothetical protein